MIAGKVDQVPHIKGEVCCNIIQSWHGQKCVNSFYFLGMEELHLGTFEMSPDGRFIVILGSYGHMHLISAQVCTCLY